MPDTIKRVLFVRLSAIGDLVHVLPAFFALREARPDVEVDWLVEDRFASILRGLSGLRNLIEVRRKKGRGRTGSLLTCRKRLRDGRYDVAFDFQGLTKSALWPFLAGVPVRVGYGDEDARELSRIFYNRKVRPSPERKHVIERNLSLVEAVFGSLPGAAIRFPSDPGAEETAERFWRGQALTGKTVVGINPGAGWETKVWPAIRYAGTARRLIEDGMSVLVLWGPGEEAVAGEIIREAPGALLAPKTSLPELVALTRRCSVFVAGDTGPLHIASALGVPTVAIFAASDPERNGPWHRPHRIVTHPIECAPCWKTTCGPGHRRCLTELDAGRVILSVRELVGKR